MATLPVTTCSSERSFSTLRRLKTYLRNTTGEDRLNGLALLNIHRDIKIDATQIIAELSPRHAVCRSSCRNCSIYQRERALY